MRSCASRFCSITNTVSCSATKSVDRGAGTGRRGCADASTCMPSAWSASKASAIAALVEPKKIAPKRVLLLRLAQHRLRHERLRGLELASAGAARCRRSRARPRSSARSASRVVPRVKYAPLLGCVPGIGAVGNAVAVDVEVAAEVLAGLELVAGHHLAAVVAASLSSHSSGSQRRWFMPMSRSVITKIGVCSRSARSSAVGRELEALARVFRKEQDVLGVAVRRIGAREQVGLLRARRHAGRGAAALDVDDRPPGSRRNRRAR